MNPNSESPVTLELLMEAHAAFCARAFPGQSFDGVLNHLIREIEEWRAEPGNRLEMADVFLLVLDAARKEGVTADALLEAAWLKLTINRHRRWPTTPDAAGVFHHTDEAKEAA